MTCIPAVDDTVSDPGPREAPASPDTLDPRALLTPRALGHPATDPHLVETHISWVVLAGERAYKIRKPVRLPFLDFTTLAARRADCERELALNRRWAPTLYLDVVPVRGCPLSPRLTGTGPVIDHAVVMRRFPAGMRLDRVAARGGLDPALCDELAETVARLHEAAPRAAQHSDHGTPTAIAREVQGNLDVLAAWRGVTETEALARVDTASRDMLADHAQHFVARRAAGRVRDCHGDLHLENLALVDGAVTPFDGVEFDPALRTVDVASDLAFLLMDLRARGHEDAANRVLDRWLQHTGDYEALTVLDHYLVYRALVRAKVSAIRATQIAGGDAHDAARSGDGEDAAARANRLIALAAALASRPCAAALVITRGVSGSGKSWLAARLAAHAGLVCLRSDVERARLYPAAPPAVRYGAEATAATYGRLATLAETVLESGRIALVDATFLDPAWRERFRRLARDKGVAFRILDLEAPRPVLERRVRQRAARGDDASEADERILARQLAHAAPLADRERAEALTLDASGTPDLARLHDWIRNAAKEVST